MNKMAVALFTILSAGCASSLPITHREASLLLKPCITAGYLTKATVGVYDRSSIDHLTIKLFQGNTELASRSLLNAQLDDPIVFSNLRSGTAYTIKSYAYFSDNSLISRDDASSWLFVTTGIDDRPTITALPVHLIDINFNASATSSIQITAGGYFNAEMEAMEPVTMIATVVGDGNGSYGGDGGPATSAHLRNPYDLVCDSDGNLFIADQNNNRIRRVDKNSGTITLIAGLGSAAYAGDNAAATSAKLNGPTGVALDSQGNIYIADKSNHRIRKVDKTSGIIITVAGNGTPAYGGEDGAATSASLNYPVGVAFDFDGNLFIADQSNHRIRRVDKNTGVITTVAGNGTNAYGGDGGVATLANLNFPARVAFDLEGNLFIADRHNHRIRRVDKNTGVITTVAGNGTNAYAGDGGAATLANLYYPSGMAFDHQNNLFIGDENNNRIRKVNLNTGIITTLAGNGNGSYGGDGGPATSACLSIPSGLAYDSDGSLYVADKSNHRIRRID